MKRNEDVVCVCVCVFVFVLGKRCFELNSKADSDL